MTRAEIDAVRNDVKRCIDKMSDIAEACAAANNALAKLDQLWAQATDDREVHVMPIKDIREHWEHAGCWCAPRIAESFDPAKGRVIVHNSADGRELVERHGVQ